MSGPVVSDAGPLMALAKLNLLHLLKQLYGRVWFPRSVYEEAVLKGIQRGFEDAHTLHLFLTQEGWQPTEVNRVHRKLERGVRMMPVFKERSVFVCVHLRSSASYFR